MGTLQAEEEAKGQMLNTIIDAWLVRLYTVRGDLGLMRIAAAAARGVVVGAEASARAIDVGRAGEDIVNTEDTGHAGVERRQNGDPYQAAAGDYDPELTLN